MKYGNVGQNKLFGLTMKGLEVELTSKKSLRLPSFCLF